MKGSVTKDMIIKLGLAIIAAGVILIVFSPIIRSASNTSIGCGGFGSTLADLSKGVADLC